MNIKIPKLRFEGFNTYKSIRVQDIFSEIKSGRDIKSDGGNFDLYGSMGIIGKSDFGTYSGKFILIARVGANAGNLSLVEGVFGVSDNTLVLSEYPDFSIEYFYYLLNRVNIKKLVFGSGQPLVTAGQLKKIKINIPSLPEQEKIADFLSSVDAYISNLRKQKESLEAYKKAMMQKIFSHEIRFKDEDGNDFPDWEEKRFNEIYKSVSTKNFQIRSSNIFATGKFPVIDQGQSIISGYSNEIDKVCRGFPIIIFGDHTTIVKYIDFQFIIGADGTKILTSKGTSSNLKFLFYLLQNFPLVPEGYKRHFSVLNKMTFLLPSLIEQNTISKFLTYIDNLIEVGDLEILKLENWKKGLMQQMFV